MAENNKDSGSRKNIAGTVRELVNDTVISMGFELWDVIYEKEGASWYLRIIIDRDTGVDINDVEAVHRALDPILDEADLIENSYYLEVSSPGIERELRTPEHFIAFDRETVTVKLYTPIDGKKSLLGVLSDFDGDSFTVTESGGTAYKLTMKDAARVNVYYDYDSDK